MGFFPGEHKPVALYLLRRSPEEYKVFIANKNALNRRKESKQLKRKIENDKKLEQKIAKLLKIGRSPEQISEEVKQVSDETIYTWVERSRKDLAVLLPQRGRRVSVLGLSLRLRRKPCRQASEARLETLLPRLNYE